jgi:hypothetical protein
MDLQKMIGELHEERRMIEEAILVLEHLAQRKGKRRGRPPGWMAKLREGQQEPAGDGGEAPVRTRKLSADARRRMSEAQKKRWSAARGEAAGDNQAKAG